MSSQTNDEDSEQEEEEPEQEQQQEQQLEEQAQHDQRDEQEHPAIVPAPVAEEPAVTEAERKEEEPADEELVERTKRRRISPVSTTIEVEVSSLIPYIRCSICFEVLSNTCTVMECLHRFCKECIEKVLRQDAQANKKCPFCRCVMGHRRTLRRDANYDGLVQLLYPRGMQEEAFDISEYHAEHRRKTREMQRTAAEARQQAARDRLPAPPPPPSRTKPPLRTAPASTAVRATPLPQPQPQPSPAPSQQPSPAHAPEEEEEELQALVPTSSSVPLPPLHVPAVSSGPPAEQMISLQLSHKISFQGAADDYSVQALEKPYLRVPAAATVSTLKRFLVQRHGLSPALDVFVSIEVNRQLVILSGDETLLEVCARRWDRASPLNLSYFIKQ